MSGGDGVHHSIPDATLPPSNEPIIASSAWTVTLKQITPRRVRAQHPKNAVHHGAVINAWHTMQLVGQERLNHAPFEVGKIISAHANVESVFLFEEIPLHSRRSKG